MELSDEQRELYTKHIDKILAKSDPESVSVSAVRNGLQDAVDEDISDYKVNSPSNQTRLASY